MALHVPSSPWTTALWSEDKEPRKPVNAANWGLRSRTCNIIENTTSYCDVLLLITWKCRQLRKAKNEGMILVSPWNVTRRLTTRQFDALDTWMINKHIIIEKTCPLPASHALCSLCQLLARAFQPRKTRIQIILTVTSEVTSYETLQYYYSEGVSVMIVGV